MKSWATRLDACYSHVTDDANIHATALERAVDGGDYDPPLMPRCHELLRGYSWVTICAPVLPPGRPNPDLLSGLRARLVMDADAADYQ